MTTPTADQRRSAADRAAATRTLAARVAAIDAASLDLLLLLEQLKAGGPNTGENLAAARARVETIREALA